VVGEQRYPIHHEQRHHAPPIGEQIMGLRIAICLFALLEWAGEGEGALMHKMTARVCW
jgi:hypothetical protein